jgi:hypothetical protein
VTQPVQPLDVVARRMIHAAEEGLRRWIGAGQIDNDLLGTLYLRVREVLEGGQLSDRDGLVDDITLIIYLTASTWQSGGEPPLDFLSSLRQAIARTLFEDSPASAPVAGARRIQ